LASIPADTMQIAAAIVINDRCGDFYIPIVNQSGGI
jgi:hypothetical protein